MNSFISLLHFLRVVFKPVAGERYSAMVASVTTSTNDDDADDDLDECCMYDDGDDDVNEKSDLEEDDEVICVDSLSTGDIFA